MKSALIFSFFSLLFITCKKEYKGCWQAFNPSGYDAPRFILCDKTEAEAEAEARGYWVYKSDEAKFCWKVEIRNSTGYSSGVPESMARRLERERGYRYTKVDCKSFCNVEWHEQHKSKITGRFGPTFSISETLLSADSCNRLVVGRIVIIRETADSLITRELVKKAP